MTAAPEEAFRHRTACVVVVSTSAAAGQAADRTGPIIRDWFLARGYDTPAPTVVADGEAVGTALGRLLQERPAVIITTGGTGVSPDDRTPEETSPFIDTHVPGMMEAFRRIGSEHTPLAALTRGVAGFAGDTFIMNLPGSPGAVADGLGLLDDMLDHVLGQRTGISGHHGDRN